MRNYGLTEGFRYLGTTFSVNNGVSVTLVVDQIAGACDKIERMALKPRKVELLVSYVLPGFYCELVAGMPSKNKLREMDGIVRGFVKRAYHLPDSASDGLVYCRRNDGGLGVPRLENLIREFGLENLD